MQSQEYPIVRRVLAGDGPAMRVLRLEMLADTPIAYAETLADAEAHPAEHWTQRAVELAQGCAQSKFVAEDAGRVVATAGGYADAWERTSVYGVYVAPGYRGTGLIDRLVEAVAEWSLGCGRDQLALEVARENPRAVAAYSRLGFTPTGASTPHPFYAEITELEMERPARWPAQSMT